MSTNRLDLEQELLNHEGNGKPKSKSKPKSKPRKASRSPVARKSPRKARVQLGASISPRAGIAASLILSGLALVAWRRAFRSPRGA